METKFDDIEWRTPDGTERRAILACSEMYYKDKLHGTLLGAALFLPAVLFLAAGISAMKVKGERQILPFEHLSRFQVDEISRRY